MFQSASLHCKVTLSDKIIMLRAPCVARSSFTVQSTWWYIVGPTLTYPWRVTERITTTLWVCPALIPLKGNANYKKLETWLCSPLPLAVNFPLTQVIPHRLEGVPEYLVRQPRSHSRIYEKMSHGVKIWTNWLDKQVGVIRQYTGESIRSTVYIYFIPHGSCTHNSPDQF